MSSGESRIDAGVPKSGLDKAGDLVLQSKGTIESALVQLTQLQG